jgi:hypothetical protein
MLAGVGGMPRMDAPERLAKKIAAGAALPLAEMAGDAPDDGETVRVYLENVFRGIARREGAELRWRAKLD